MAATTLLRIPTVGRGKRGRVPQSVSFTASDLLRMLQDRTRKAFAAETIRLSCDRSASDKIPACRVLKLEWNVSVHNIESILRYWNGRSALERCGLSQCMDELLGRARPLSRVTLIVWRLDELLHEHLRLHPPVLPALVQPFVVQPQHILPITEHESSFLRHKPRFREFCIRQMHWEVESYCCMWSESNISRSTPQSKSTTRATYTTQESNGVSSHDSWDSSDAFLGSDGDVDEYIL